MYGIWRKGGASNVGGGFTRLSREKPETLGSRRHTLPAPGPDPAKRAKEGPGFTWKPGPWVVQTSGRWLGLVAPAAA